MSDDARIRAMQEHVNSDGQPPGHDDYERQWAAWSERVSDWHRQQTEPSPDVAAAMEEKRIQHGIINALHQARPSTERTWTRPGEYATEPQVTNRERRERFAQPVPGEWPGLDNGGKPVEFDPHGKCEREPEREAG
jgi:hypothetical protein